MILKQHTEEKNNIHTILQKTLLTMKKLKLTLISLLAIALNISAVNYYASPTGTGDGSSIAAAGSFATGKSKLSTIDTLYLLDGQYDFTAKISISQSGTASSRKVIAAYPGETPILDFRNQPYGAEITGSDNVGISISEGITYVHLKGLTVRYAGKAGIINYGKQCIIENCEVYGCCDVGIQMKKGGANLIKNCDAHDNFDYKTLEGTAANYGGNADGFADKQYTTPVDLNDAPNIYESCRSWHNSDDGWDFYQRIGCSILNNCIAYQNGPEYFDMSAHPRRLGVDSTYFKSYEGAGQTVTDRYGNSVNITVAHYVNIGNGNGFKIGGGYTAHNVTLNRCFAVANVSAGFDKNNNGGNMYVYNGTSYKNKINYGFGNASYGTLSIKNSLELEGASSSYFDVKSLVSHHNSWTSGAISCNANDFVSLDTTLIRTARNADGSLAVTDLLRLVDGSDMIDAGIDAKLAYAGAAPDLGCYEKGIPNQYPGVVNNPANKNQIVVANTDIAPIVFTWSGGATGLSLANLPAGLTQTVDDAAKTLTISGATTAAAGTYNYLVTTMGGTAIPDSVWGSFTVQSISIPTNKDQTIVASGTIANIVFSWVGDATGMSVSGLPAGLNSALDVTAKTLTISGTTTASVGNYSYTVKTEGGLGIDSVKGSILVIAAFNYTKYYNIYTYGVSGTGNATTAKTTDLKRYITADATGKVLLIAGLSDDGEIAAGKADSMRTAPSAQWIIAAGTADGFITARNRETGKYLQVSGTLSSTPIEFIPVYKKDDNGIRANAISVSATGSCIQMSGTTTVSITTYADRTRMRWIFAESEDIATSLQQAKIKTDFLKNTLIDEELVLLNPENFERLEIINLSGLKLISAPVQAASINLSALPTGIYLAKAITKNGDIYICKIVKK